MLELRAWREPTSGRSSRFVADGSMLLPASPYPGDTRCLRIGSVKPGRSTSPRGGSGCNHGTVSRRLSVPGRMAGIRPPSSRVVPGRKPGCRGQPRIGRRLPEPYLIGARCPPPAFTAFIERREQPRIHGDRQRGGSTRRKAHLRPTRQPLRCLPAAGLRPNIHLGHGCPGTAADVSYFERHHEMTLGNPRV